MKYVQLGKSDLKVSPICFGCWQLSPKFWGDVPIPEWEKAVQRALDLGVNFFDTADAYGEGYAEESLGKLMKRENLRDKMIVATKFFWNFVDNAEERFPDTRYDYILRACEASLKRLQTDCIDLYQIHAWDTLTRPEEVGAALLRLKKEGKVRWFGVSNLKVEQMSAYRRYFDIESLQPHYNLLYRNNEEREFPYCLEHRISVMAYSPLQRGILSGKYAPGHQFDDPRSEDARCTGEMFKVTQEGVAQLKPFADKYGLTIAQLAVRWILTHPALTCAIMGVKKPEHIETILPAAEGAIDPLDWHQMGKIMDKVRKNLNALTEK